MRKTILASLVVGLVAVLSYAAATQVKVGDFVYVNLSLQNTAEDVYRVETDLYWPNEYLKLASITKANNTQFKELDTPEGMAGVSMNWVNVKGVKEGNYASFGFTTLKPTDKLVLEQPSVRVYNKENQLIASRADAEMEVAIAERAPVVITFRASTSATVDSSVNDLEEKK